jgi:hypothetical protein
VAELVVTGSLREPDLGDQLGVTQCAPRSGAGSANGNSERLATVSGTNGLAGAADAVLVLERPRAQADGVLHVTGRDVEEVDYALGFDPGIGAWSMLDGPAEEHLMTDSRALIYRYLRDYAGTKPAGIAEALDLPANTVRQTCKRMADAGQLRATGGAYYPPTSGDSSDTPGTVTAVTLSL